MSAAFGRLLRGGRPGRRIRVKAILLSGARRNSGDYQRWLRLEMCKGLLPALFIVVLGQIGLRPPMWIGGALIVAGLVWMAFVLINASAAVFRLNQRHAAYMNEIGAQADAAFLFGSGRAWRLALGGATLRDYVADVKSRQSRSV